MTRDDDRFGDVDAPLKTSFGSDSSLDWTPKERSLLVPGVRLGDHGRYEVVRPVGRGGMGVVYAATDRFLQREVALKVMAPQWEADARARERFIREARVCLELTDPGIVRVHNLEHDAGREVIFIVMELLQGESLRARMLRAQAVGLYLNAREAVAITDGVLRALQAAHERTVHRDLKPENVFITREQRVKVLDFGVARALGSRFTRPGVSIGTTGYMAPEQQQGARGVDARADLYSVGVMLYEMLTGRRPLGHDFDRPSWLCESLSGAIDEVILCALARRERRFKSAQQMREALERATGPGDRAAIARPVAPTAAAAASASSGAVVGDPFWTSARPIPAAPLPALPADPFDLPDESSATTFFGPPGPAGLESAIFHDTVPPAPTPPAPPAPVPAAPLPALPSTALLTAQPRVQDPELLVELGRGQQGRLTLLGALGTFRMRNAAPPLFGGYGPEGVATGDADGWIRVWDPIDGRELRAIDTGIGSVSRGTVSADGTAAAALSQVGDLVVVDLESGEIARCNASPYGAAATTVAAAGRGRPFATGSADGSVTIFGPDAQVRCSFWRVHDGPVTGLAISPDGRRVLSVGMGHDLHLADVTRGKRLVYQRQSRPIHAVAFLPGGDHFVLARDGGDVQLWKTRSSIFTRCWLRLVRRARRGTNHVGRLAVTPDGRKLIEATVEGEVRVRSLPDLALISEPAPQIRRDRLLAVAPEGDHFVFGRRSGRVSVGRIGWQDAVPATVHSGPIMAIAFGPDGRRLLSGSRRQAVRAWDAASMQARPATAPAIGRSVRSVSYSPDGRFAATTAAPHGGLELWQVATGARVAQFVEPDSYALECLFSPDGRLLAAANADGTIGLWDVTGGRPVRRFLGHRGATITAMAFTPDGRHVVAAARDRPIRMWRVVDGAERTEASGDPFFELVPGSPTHLAVSPDGRRLVAGFEGGGLRSWDIETGALRRFWLVSHRAPLTALAFCGPGLVAAAAEDGKVILVCAANGNVRDALDLSTIGDRATALAAGDGRLAIGTARSAVLVYALGAPVAPTLLSAVPGTIVA